MEGEGGERGRGRMKRCDERERGEGGGLTGIITSSVAVFMHFVLSRRTVTCPLKATSSRSTLGMLS